MSLDTFKSLVSNELNAVNDIIITQLKSKVELINDLGSHIIKGGGKRIRPLLTLLTAKACDYKGNQHIDLAAVIELIHTATLLHDDVVDNSQLRRGRPTANAKWGNEASVLVGDYLYTRAFQIMVRTQNLNALSCLANATNTIAEGEVLQLLHCHDPDTTEDTYMQVISNKTATLFAAAAELAGIIAQRTDDECKALAHYGLHLGNAFQLVDDSLDYKGDVNTIGKNIGDDLAEGKPTLPLIHALNNTDGTKQQLIRDTITQGNIEKLDDIIEIITESGAIEYTYQVARQQIDEAITALQFLPESPYRDALASLAQFSIERSH